MRLMPFDVQTCSIEFLSYTLDLPITLNFSDYFKNIVDQSGMADCSNSEWRTINISLSSSDPNTPLSIVSHFNY